jgi:hypothetical protein
MLSGNKLELCTGIDAHCVNGPTRVVLSTCMEDATLFGTQSLPGQGKITLMYRHGRCQRDLEKYTETVYGLKERLFRQT